MLRGVATRKIKTPPELLMEAYIDLVKVKSLAGLLIAIEGLPRLEVQELKVHKAYWITCGTEKENIFVAVDLTSPYSIRSTYRVLDKRTLKYKLERSCESIIKRNGWKNFINEFSSFKV